MTPPAKAATPVPTPTSTVAGTNGGGETTAATAAAATTAPATAVGVGDLSGILKQLTDAVALLTKAIAGMQSGVGGGGPIQMPPGKGIVIQGGGSGIVTPYTQIRGRLDKLDASPVLNAEMKAKLVPIRTELQALDAKANQTGATNPAASLRLNVMIDLAMIGPAEPRHAQLTKVVADLRALEATSEQTGSISQIELQRIDQAAQAALRLGPPTVA